MFLMDHPGFLNMLLAAPGFLGFAGTGGRSRPSRSQDMDRRAVVAFDTWKQNRWKFGHKLPAGRYHPLAITYHNSIQFLFIRIYTILSCSLFPKQVYLWGSILEKRDWTRWWARCAALGADLAVLGALGWAGLGVRFGRAGRAGLGWAACWAWIWLC